MGGGMIVCKYFPSVNPVCIYECKIYFSTLCVSHGAEFDCRRAGAIHQSAADSSRNHSRRPVPDSLTSPSAEKAAEQNTQIPGGFTVKTADDMKKGRTSNFLDLLSGVPGLFMQSENGVEISKVSIRGSGIESDDEPLGVEFLLDGISFDQGDGETIIEDFDVSTLKYAEVYRGADASTAFADDGRRGESCSVHGLRCAGVSVATSGRQLRFHTRRGERRRRGRQAWIIMRRCRDVIATVIARTAGRRRSFCSPTSETKSATTWKTVFISRWIRRNASCPAD